MRQIRRNRKNKSLSVFIPFFNEEKAVSNLRKRLVPVLDSLCAQWDIQLVLVDDGSSDKTYEALMTHFLALESAKTVILRHEANRGIGGAMRTAFEVVKGDIVCTLDSDCTYAPEKMPEMMDFLINNNADIVTGSPYHPNGGVENVNPQRLLLSKTASIMYSFLVPTKLHCYTSFFRAYRRKWARPDLFSSNGFLAVTEILLEAANSGARIVEFPITMGTRKIGSSKMKVARVTFDHLGLMCKTAVANAFLTASGSRNTMRDHVTGMSFVGHHGADLFGEDANMRLLLKQWVRVGRIACNSGCVLPGMATPGKLAI